MKSKEERYRAALGELKLLLEDETDPIVWMSSLVCLLEERMGFFWVGFYRVVQGELRIGPYRGTLGCLRISFDRGVCGACASRKETVLVPDVHEFPGHIACDSRSRSEIVVPILDSRGELRAVLDVDSDELDDFDLVDREFLEQIADLMRELNWEVVN